MDVELNSSLVTAGATLVGVVMWFSRLESKVTTNERDIRREEAARIETAKNQNKRIEGLETKHAELDEKLMEKLASIEKIVANIQGQLSK